MENRVPLKVFELIAEVPAELVSLIRTITETPAPNPYNATAEVGDGFASDRVRTT